MSNEQKFACDFETTTTTPIRVWGSACWCIDTNQLMQLGNDIESFMDFISTRRFSHTCYFHNLKFDGNFIISHLLKMGYGMCYSEKDLEPKTFTTLITDEGAFYQIIICHSSTTKTIKHRDGRSSKKVTKLITTIRDSLKKIALPISKMPKMFGL